MYHITWQCVVCNFTSSWCARYRWSCSVAQLLFQFPLFFGPPKCHQDHHCLKCCSLYRIVLFHHLVLNSFFTAIRLLLTTLHLVKVDSHRKCGRLPEKCQPPFSLCLSAVPCRRKHYSSKKSDMESVTLSRFHISSHCLTAQELNNQY